MPIDLSFAINLPPEKAIEYFEEKGYAISFRWDNMLNEAHAKAFTVAGAMKLDLLAAIRGELDTALKQGKTLQSFRREMEPILKKHGFWGEVETTDPQSGEVRTTNVTPWRLRTIYRTNMQSAYMAGRYQAQMEDDNRPYLQYVALMDAKTRDSHAELHGTVLHKDDPFWDENYPPNGWGCRCRVRARSKRDVERRGLKVLDRGKAKGVAEKGFKSNPGANPIMTDLMAWDKAKALPDSIKYQFIADQMRPEERRKILETALENMVPGKPRGRILTGGYMGQQLYPTVLKQHSNIPAVIAISEERLNHALRPGKRNTPDDMKGLTDAINNPSHGIYFDSNLNSYEFIHQVGGKLMKYSFKVGTVNRVSGKMLNFVTATDIQEGNLNQSNYKKIR